MMKTRYQGKTFAGMDMASEADMSGIIVASAKFHEKDIVSDLKKMVEESKEQMVWNTMVGEEVRTRNELDFEILRDILVDMCSATQSESPPSQEDWSQIRDMVKVAAVKHALLTREEKKASGKGSFGPSAKKFFTVMPSRYGKSQMFSDMQLDTLSAQGIDGSKPLSGRSAGLLIIDDVI